MHGSINFSGLLTLRQKNPKNIKKALDILALYAYNKEAVWFAAIAQQAERVLGKDEVASSNLASSSKISEAFGHRRFFLFPGKTATSSALAEGKELKSEVVRSP